MVDKVKPVQKEKSKKEKRLLPSIIARATSTSITTTTTTTATTNTAANSMLEQISRRRKNTIDLTLSPREEKSNVTTAQNNHVPVGLHYVLKELFRYKKMLKEERRLKRKFRKMYQEQCKQHEKLTNLLFVTDSNLSSCETPRSVITDAAASAAITTTPVLSPSSCDISPRDTKFTASDDSCLGRKEKRNATKTPDPPRGDVYSPFHSPSGTCTSSYPSTYFSSSIGNGNHPSPILVGVPSAYIDGEFPIDKTSHSPALSSNAYCSSNSKRENKKKRKRMFHEKRDKREKRWRIDKNKTEMRFVPKVRHLDFRFLQK